MQLSVYLADCAEISSLPNTGTDKDLIQKEKTASSFTARHSHRQQITYSESSTKHHESRVSSSFRYFHIIKLYFFPRAVWRRTASLCVQAGWSAPLPFCGEQLKHWSSQEHISKLRKTNSPNNNVPRAKGLLFVLMMQQWSVTLWEGKFMDKNRMHSQVTTI